ncbi:MAG TPA: hypothetical protein VMH38_01040 [Thermoplasmata archaeon]|nr:hypothetical protein [Thermoplasmata archaeon]
MHSPRTRRVEPALAFAALAIVALLLNIPAPAHASSPVAAVSTQPGVSSSGYSVTWNGVDVATAGSASSAFSVDLSQTASLWYNWSTGVANPVDISDARLQMFYLGFAVSTRDQVLTNPTAQPSGSISLSWTPVSVAYLLEGVYRLTASFLAPNGTTMWSENFYIRGTAPLGVAAVLPIVLLVIIVYEVYGLARSGRYAALGRKVGESPPATPPSTSTAPPPSTSEAAEPSAPPTDSAGGPAPPTGGGS